MSSDSDDNIKILMVQSKVFEATSTILEEHEPSEKNSSK